MPPIPNFDKEMIQKQKLNLRPSGYETEEVNMVLAQPYCSQLASMVTNMKDRLL